MPGDAALPRSAPALRPACAPFDLSTLERRRRDYLGRLSDLVDDLAWPILGGVAAWAHACGLTGLLRCVKTSAG